MVEIPDWTSTDFSVVDATWSRKRALQFAEALEAGYIIVRKAMPGRATRFYLLALDEFQRRLQQSTRGRVMTLLSVLDPDPTLSQDAILRAAVTRAIAVDGGEPVAAVEPAAAQPEVFEQMEAAAPEAQSAGNGTQRRGGTRARRGGGGRQDSGGGPRVPRTLVGEMPAVIKTGEPATTLSVTLTARAVSGANAGSLSLPAGARIDVIVRADAPLEVQGDETASFIVQDPQPDDVRKFKVIAHAKGAGRVHVYAFHAGVPLVVLEVTTEVADALPAQLPPPATTRTDVDMTPRRDLELSLYVFERGDEISFYLQSADKRFNMKPFPSVKLNTPRVYFQDFFRAIENLPPDEAQAALRVSGLNLFRTAMPKELRKALWTFKDSVRTLQINSDEPWIPWEVCKLEGLVDGSVAEGPYFAEAFNVTRWFAGVSVVPRITLANIALLVPGDSGLASAPDEKRYMESLRGGSRRVDNIVPRKSKVTDAMQTAKYDAWHFTGHAQAPVTVNANEAPIDLDNSEKLTPEDIVGSTSNLLKTKPFIFFNACQSARGGMSLTGAGGWAQRFIKDTEELPSAAAFVGTYWQVDDDKAFAFAKALYERLINVIPIGQAAQEARRAAQSGPGEPYDTSWLAYTVYADPSAVVAPTR